MARDLLNDLNDKQREAVEAPMGPVLVLAGAGSGKTRALTYRIAWLIQNKLVKPENILAVTFTNKAASEMKERVQALLTKELKNKRTKEQQVHKFLGSSVLQSITMGTFHSVCVRMLRADIERLGVGRDRNFTIYDAEDSRGLLKQIILELGIDREYKPRMFGYYISQAKNRLIGPKELDIGREYVQRLVEQVYELYQDRLRESNAVDFDDLLALTVRLLKKDKKVLEKYRHRFQYILVDEYQDTNHAQYMMLKLLSEKHRNIFVVGDDAQSIYGFRGANMQNILNFAKDYKGAKVIMLEQNYRSSQNILSTANKVISLNPFQYEKDLWTENEGGEKVSLYEALDEVDESEHVVSVILEGSRQKDVTLEGRSPDRVSRDSIAQPAASLQNDRLIYVEDESYEDSDQDPDSILDKFKSPKWMKRNRRSVIAAEFPKDLSETAILYRTHAQSRAFEEAMMSAGIPYQIVGGIRFYERREIKDLLAYLRLVINPRDLVSLSRVINLPARGIGSVSFKKIKQTLQKQKFDFSRILVRLPKLALSARADSGAREFFELIDKAQNLPEKKTVLDLMDLLLKGSGYKDSLLDGSEEGETRWENIQELINVAAKFKNLPWREGLQEFLEEVALMTDLDKTEEGGNRLTMMTLHSAKGLEFKKIFFVGLEEGLLPHSRSIMNPEEIAEEIRLAYVGMTRAREELFLSYAKSRQVFGEFRQSIPSRVIKAIPKNLLKKLN